jgi:hypothetical protein
MFNTFPYSLLSPPPPLLLHLLLPFKVRTRSQNTQNAPFISYLTFPDHSFRFSCKGLYKTYLAVIPWHPNNVIYQFLSTTHNIICHSIKLQSISHILTPLYISYCLLSVIAFTQTFNLFCLSTFFILGIKKPEETPVHTTLRRSENCLWAELVLMYVNQIIPDFYVHFNFKFSHIFV